MRLQPTCSAIIVAVASGTIATAPHIAQAQQSTCTVSPDEEARRDQARAGFQQGESFFQSEQYGEAMASFECSFQNVPHPSTLYNIARAAELAGSFQRALAAWRGYLQMNPEAEDRQEIEGRIEGLDQALRAGGVTPDSSATTAPETGTAGTPPPTTTSTTAQPTAQPAVGAQVYQPGVGWQQPPPPAAAAPADWETPRNMPTDVYAPAQVGQQYQFVERTPPSPWRLYAWGFLGGGVLAAAVGGLLAYGSYADTEEAFCPADNDPHSTSPGCFVGGWVLMGVGAAAMVTAVMLWLFTDPGSERVVTRRAGFSPTLSYDDRGRVDGARGVLHLAF
jgi:hypothetical protein